MEIKKCPFCGGEALFFRVGTVLGDCVVVKCKNCKARTDTILFDARKHPNDEEYDEAAALWNNRKPVDDVLERLERKKKDAYDTAKVYEFDSWWDSARMKRAEAVAFEKAIKIMKEELGGDSNV